MKLEAHEKAIAAINARADALVKAVEEIPEEVSVDLAHPDIPATIIHASSIKAEPDVAIVLQTGETIARYFVEAGSQWGLRGQGYAALLSLADQVRNKIPDTLSQEYLEVHTFRWVRNRFRDKAQSITFWEQLSRDVEQDVTKRTLWIPIANLVVHGQFDFCGVTIAPMPKQFFDDWARQISSIALPDAEPGAQAIVDRSRRRFQGRAGARVRVEAEPKRAFERATEDTELAVSLLTMLCGAQAVPGLRSKTAIAGAENPRYATAIQTVPSWSITESPLERSAPDPIIIDQERHRLLMGSGLARISEMVSKRNPSSFEEALVNALGIYSRVAYIENTVEKLVYTLSSLESLFLKDGNEPIQQNLGERMAMFIGQTLDERKYIIEITKSVYKLRSQFVHHGRMDSANKQTVATFLEKCFTLYLLLIVKSGEYADKPEFIARLDDMKLSPK